MFNGVKQIILKTIESMGYVMLKKDHKLLRCNMEGAIKSLAKRDLSFQTVIDVGASNGGWSKIAMESFHSTNYLLIEAQPVHQKDLDSFCKKHKNTQYVLTAAGDRDGEIYFDATDPFGGQASNQPYPENNIVVPINRVDTLVSSLNLSGPYFLKLDTHGFEIPILEGAAGILDNVEVLMIECYNFKLSDECLLFHEMIAYMENSGFRCIDLVDVLHRPGDNAVWQMDLVFLRSNRKEFSESIYN
jgi:FkbM family methyltransferase